MSGSRSRTWISAEISPELMESLERRAKARGISRSEGLRQALRQWSTGEDWDTYTAQERGRRMVARLDDLKEEILLQIAGEGPETSAAENSTGKDARAETCAEAGAEDYQPGLIQLELYGAEEPPEYLDREAEKAREQEQDGDAG